MYRRNRRAGTGSARVIADIVADLLGTDWADQNRHTRPVTADDVLVVAPYNVQAARLRDVIAPVVRVGIADKFQGRE